MGQTTIFCFISTGHKNLRGNQSIAFHGALVWTNLKASNNQPASICNGTVGARCDLGATELRCIAATEALSGVATFHPRSGWERGNDLDQHQASTIQVNLRAFEFSNHFWAENLCLPLFLTLHLSPSLSVSFLSLYLFLGQSNNDNNKSQCFMLLRRIQPVTLRNYQTNQTFFSEACIIGQRHSAAENVASHHSHKTITIISSSSVNTSS